MGTAFGWASSAAAVIGIAACGGTAIDTTRSGHPAESGGSGGNGVTAGAGGFSTAGTGTGGALGSTGGMPSSDISFVFSVAGGNSLCRHGCVPPSVSIGDSSGHTLELGNWCRTDCATCSTALCPAVPCLPDEEITRVTAHWDGTYYAPLTCGHGTSCLEAMHAPPGKYVASVCATQGTVTHNPDGSAECAPGCSACGFIDFELPSTGILEGTIDSDRLYCH